MAAPMIITRQSHLVKFLLLRKTCAEELQTFSKRTAFFWQKKKKEDAEDEVVRKITPKDGPTTVDRFKSLKKKTSVMTKKAYSPPHDLAERVGGLVGDLYDKVDSDWQGVQLQDQRLKFKLLTRLMRDLNHNIPNLELHNMKTAGDVLKYFSQPVRDTSTYEDLTKLDLPKNMHIQLEPVRFDAETDTMFGGRTAFPGRETVVTSLRYKNKYGKKND